MGLLYLYLICHMLLRVCVSSSKITSDMCCVNCKIEILLFHTNFNEIVMVHFCVCECPEGDSDSLKHFASLIHINIKNVVLGCDSSVDIATC